MKKFYKMNFYLLLFVLYSMFFINKLEAQGDSWVAKTVFSGTPRYGVAVFVIGSKAYLGTGLDQVGNNADFWEWDQATNVWSQKADFGGGARAGGVGFSIGTKGYVGMGYDGALYKNDFWEWDQTTNTWTQKASLLGDPRLGAVGFSIGTKGYIGTGYTGTTYKNDFWEWDQTIDTWTQKANCGTGKAGCVGFTIGGKGYIATGKNASSNLADLLEWNPTTNTWVAKAVMPGKARSGAVGFVLGSKAYISTGYSNDTLSDTWEWNQLTNTWASKAKMPAAARHGGVGFAINGKGYLATGYDCQVYYKDLWEYTPTCSAVSSFNASATTICQNDTVYYTNTSTGATSYIWKNNGVAFSTATDTFYIYTTAGFDTIQLYASNGTCSDSSALRITVKARPAGNAGYDVTICPGDSVQLSASGGVSYSWSPSTGLNNPNIANPKASPASSINYMVTVAAANGCTKNDTVAVNVASSLIADAGPDTSFCSGSSVALNASGGSIYSWNPGTGLSCTSCPNPIATPLVTTTYIVTVSSGSCGVDNDTVKVTVKTTPFAYAGTDVTICTGDSTQFNASGGVSYSWSPTTGLSNPNIANPKASPGSSTDYIVVVSDGTGDCKMSDTMRVNVVSGLIANAGSDTSICAGNAVTLNGSGGGDYSWSPASGLNCTHCQNPVASPLITTSYVVTVTSGSCAPSSDTIKVTIIPLPAANAGADVTICKSDSTELNASGGLSYIWSPTMGLSDPYIANPYAKPLSTTAYSVSVYGTNGCTATDAVNVMVEVCTGIAHITNDIKAIIFPNPANNELNIQITSTELLRVNLEIINIQGQRIYNNNSNKTSVNYNEKIDVASFARGIYYIKISVNDVFSVHKLIVE